MGFTTTSPGGMAAPRYSGWQAVDAGRIVGADEAGDAFGVVEGHVAGVQPGRQEPRQRVPEQGRAQVIQLRQPKGVRGVQELPERDYLQGLGEDGRSAAADVVRGEAEVAIDVRENLREVSGLAVIG